MPSYSFDTIQTGNATFPKVLLEEQGSTPTTPNAGKQNVYVRSSDGHLVRQDDGGTVHDLESGATTLDALTDVDVPAPSDGDVLTYQATSPAGWVAAAPSVGGVPTVLDDLTDVSVPSPSDGDVLTYSTGSPTGWIASAPTGGSGLTDPSTLSGLKLWLKADAGVYKDAGVTLAADTDTVQQWNDQSGNSNHVSQATSGKRPTYRTGLKNGLPLLQFGSGKCMQLASVGVSTLTLLMVFKNGTANAILVELSATVNSNDGFYLFSASTDCCTMKKSGTLSGRIGPSAWGETNQYIVAGQQFTGKANDHYFLLNGNQSLSSPDTVNDPGTGTTTDTLNIGARNNAASNSMNGDICELLLYTPALSMANARAVMAYLQTRWDI